VMTILIWVVPLVLRIFRNKQPGAAYVP
jgi:hypothetical protein